MKTYIRRNISGYYIEFPEEIDTQYWEGKIGTTYEDFLMDKWIKLSDEQLAFHNDHLNASIKEVLEMQITPVAPHVRTLEEAKQEKIYEIIEYDSSENVNSFTIEGNPMWLTREDRTQIDESIGAYDGMGQTQMTKFFGGVSFTFPLTVWRQMLDALIVYASEALNVTEAHKTAVNALETIEEVDAFDITVGYPSKLEF